MNLKSLDAKKVKAAGHEEPVSPLSARPALDLFQTSYNKLYSTILGPSINCFIACNWIR